LKLVNIIFDIIVVGLIAISGHDVAGFFSHLLILPASGTLEKHSSYGESSPTCCYYWNSSEKNNPHIRVLAGFLEFYVLKYGAKFIAILMPLAGFWRGANLPYFSKRDNIFAYFPHEQKRGVLRGFLA
jgi:hypothetical protein